MVEQVEDLWSWFHEQPERLLNLGSGCLTLGFVLVASGLWGMVAKEAMNAMKRLAKQPLDDALSSLYPNLLTWWIPESILGILFTLLLLVYGAILIYHGKKIKRILN